MNQEYIFPLYVSQLIHGCESLTCKNTFCRSSPTCSVTFENSLQKAKDLASNHNKSNLLCKNLSNLLIDPLTLNILVQFNEVLPNFISGQITPLVHDSIRLLFSNSNSFCYILLSQDFTLTKSNLLLNDEKIIDFINSLEDKEPIFIKYQSLFITLVDNILNFSNDLLKRIRGIFCILFFPFFFPLIGIKIITEICSFSSQNQSILINELSKLPKFLRYLTILMKNFISNFLNNNNLHPHSFNMHVIASFINILHYSNYLLEKPLIPSFFSNELFTSFLIPNFEFENFKKTNKIFSYIDLSSILTIQFKTQLVHLESSLLKTNKEFKINVRRDHIVEDSFKILISKSNIEYHKKLIISFEGEIAQDDGGVSKEFFYLLINQLFDQSFGIFNLLNNQYYWFNLKNIQKKQYYFFVGVLVGLALFNGFLLPIKFPNVLYKKICKKELILSDLEDIYPEIYNSLNKWKNDSIKGRNISEDMVYFNIIDENNNLIELIPNGSKILVNNDNINNYINFYVQYLLINSIEIQFNSFLEGYKSVCDTPLINILKYDELNILISGEDHYDWDQLKINTVYDGYLNNSPSILMFWEIFDNYKEEMKKNILRFITGCDKAPPGGLSSIILKIQRSGDIKLLPTAHTFKNIFVLPDYNDSNKMKNSLIICCNNIEGLFIV